MQIHSSQIEDFHKHYWAKFINSLSGFKSANLVGSTDNNFQSNLAIVSSSLHLGANPPLMGLLFRPALSPRHSLSNIKELKHFSLNHVNKDFFSKAHQTSARYPKTTSEFDAVGLTEEYVDGFKAPFVKEAKIKIALEMLRVEKIHENDTELVIAKILWADFPKDCLSEDGYLDIEKAGTLCVSGLDSYHNTQQLARLSYAKTDMEPSIIQAKPKNETKKT